MWNQQEEVVAIYKVWKNRVSRKIKISFWWEVVTPVFPGVNKIMIDFLCDIVEGASFVAALGGEILLTWFCVHIACLVPPQQKLLALSY